MQCAVLFSFYYNSNLHGKIFSFLIFTNCVLCFTFFSTKSRKPASTALVQNPYFGIVGSEGSVEEFVKRCSV